MHVRFSLVLVDDQAPTLRRPLSPFSTSVLALQQQQMASTIDQAVASTVGPNRFVVAISDTPHSWLAFQVSFITSVILCARSKLALLRACSRLLAAFCVVRWFSFRVNL
jgi:hypothetical protein